MRVPLKHIKNIETFNNAKYEDNIEILCTCCKKYFLRRKKLFLDKLRKGDNVNLSFYCSKDCENKTKFKNKSFELNCQECGKLIKRNLCRIKKHKHQFCDHSCSAKYSNKTRKRVKWSESAKQAHSKKMKEKNIKWSESTKQAYSKKMKERNIKWSESAKQAHSKKMINFTPKLCIICNNKIPYEKRHRKTCSANCLSINQSKAAKRNLLGGSLHPKEVILINGDKLYVDSTWEMLLANDLIKENIRWNKPKKFLLTNGSTYTPDFYLLDYNVYIDPKSLFKKWNAPSEKQKTQLQNIKQFEKEFNAKCILITEKKNLTWDYIKSQTANHYTNGPLKDG